MSRAPKRQLPLSASTDSDLREDALAGQKLSAEADDESHHGEAAIPGFSERREAELGVHSVIKKLYNHTGLLVRQILEMCLLDLFLLISWALFRTTLPKRLSQARQ